VHKIASTKNQSHRFNAETYACLLTCSGASDWCRWTFNVEKYVGKPPPELHYFAHIPPSGRKIDPATIDPFKSIFFIWEKIAIDLIDFLRFFARKSNQTLGKD